ncbi:MAG: PAS domain S-box protein [Candidatus Thermoplasmatota archaeon]|nr:PAS domain S-box protein [Candidatus Thermoplasmatota archaeon]
MSEGASGKGGIEDVHNGIPDIPTGECPYLERLIDEVTPKLFKIPSEQIDRSIMEILSAVGENIGADRSYIFLFNEDRTRMTNTHEWVRLGVVALKDRFQDIPVLAYPWLAGRILNGEIITNTGMEKSAHGSVQGKKELESQGVLTFLNIPIKYQGSVVGFIGFGTAFSTRTWSEQCILLLGSIGDMIVNVLSRKWMEEELQFSREKYKALFDLSPQGIAILDLDGRIIEYNNAMGSLSDMPRDSIIGRPFTDLEIVEKEDMPRLVGMMMDLMDGKSVGPVEVRLNMPGRHVWIEVHSGLIRMNDEVRGIQILSLDITRRKQAEFETMKFKSVFDNASFGAVLTDMEGIIVYANDKMARMHAYSVGELLGNHISMLQEGMDPSVMEGITEGMMKKGRSNAMELRQSRKDGSEFPVLMNGTLIIGPEGSPTHIAATMVDITEIYEARELIKEERYRAEFYLDLLSHDIGNLHQGISSWTAFAVDPGSDDDRRNLALKRIDELQRRALKLVRNVLLLSRLKNMKVDLREIELMGMIRRSSDDVAGMFPDKHVHVEIVSEKDEVRIMGEQLMEEIFFNLIQNSYKFIEKGEGRITVRVDHGDDRTVITFCDNGPGIPDDLKSEVLSRMGRSGKHRNTGIGLSLVKELVERYGGTLTISDRVPGEHSDGVCFTMDLQNGGRDR